MNYVMCMTSPPTVVVITLNASPELYGSFKVNPQHFSSFNLGLDLLQSFNHAEITEEEHQSVCYSPGVVKSGDYAEKEEICE